MFHTFSVEVATEYGVDKAIILHNFYFWVKENQANKRNIYKGKAYTYNTAEAFAELFPYLKPRKIAELLRDMEYDGLIESIQNKGTNRVKSYTLTEKGWSYYTTVHSISNVQKDDTPSYEIPTMEHTENRLCSITDSKHTYNKHTDNILSEEKEETTPIKSEREIELEKSFDEALANLPSSPIENCDNTKRNVSVTKGSTKKRTKKNCVRAEQLEDDEFYKPVYEAYRSAFFSLYDKGTIPNCGKYKSFVDDCLKRYRELELSNIQIRDLIVTAINNAKSDKFIVQKRFPIAMILSESVMPRLVDTVKTTDDPKVGVDFNSQNYGV